MSALDSLSFFAKTLYNRPQIRYYIQVELELVIISALTSNNKLKENEWQILTVPSHISTSVRWATLTTVKLP